MTFRGRYRLLTTLLCLSVCTQDQNVFVDWHSKMSWLLELCSDSLKHWICSFWNITKLSWSEKLYYPVSLMNEFACVCVCVSRVSIILPKNLQKLIICVHGISLGKNLPNMTYNRTLSYSSRIIEWEIVFKIHSIIHSDPLSEHAFFFFLLCVHQNEYIYCLTNHCKSWQKANRRIYFNWCYWHAA